MAQVTAPPPAEVKPAPLRDPPLWEAGVALVTVAGPDYPAAGTSRARAALAPIILYRGKRLRIDDEGVRSRLLNRGYFELDVSGAAAFNASNNQAREGMPELDYLFEVGPQARYRVPLGGGHQVSAHLKARGVFSSDLQSIHARGYVIEPELRWLRRGWPGPLSEWQLSLQADWASETLQDYFYQVDPAYATSARSAYDARSGYLGSSLRLSYTRRLNTSTVFIVSATLSQHAGAANRASPLFERTGTGSVLASVMWTPWQGGSAAIQD